MSRNRRSARLAPIAAVLAVLLIAVAPASAGLVEVGGGGTVTIKAPQTTKAKWGTTIGPFECTTAELNGTVSGSSETLAAAPVLKGCGGAIFFSLNANKCKFAFHLDETVTGVPDEVQATMDIVECPKAAPMTWTISSGCKAVIEEQFKLKGITVKNETGETPTDLKLTMAVAEIAYNLVGSKSECLNVETGLHTGAKGASISAVFTIKDAAGSKALTVT